MSGEESDVREGKGVGHPHKGQFRIVILINKTNFLLRQGELQLGGKEDAIGYVRNLSLKDLYVTVSPKIV